MESQAGNSRTERIDSLLRGCIFFGVLAVVFQFAEDHYFRSLVAAAAFFVVLPWLGKEMDQSVGMMLGR